MPRPCRHLWAAALLACLFFLLSPPEQVGAAPRAVATVIAERGLVRIQPSGTTQFHALGRQVDLSAGDLILTGPDGEAALLFSDGSQVKLDANSTLRITAGAHSRPGENLFQALLGVIWAHLRPGQTVHAGTSNIVVRGTEFVVAVTPDSTTTLTVVAGDVLFSNAGATVEVLGSQQSIARPQQAPTPPVAVDVSGLIAWTADVTALPLEFERPGLTSATKGPAEYATDAAQWEAQTRSHPDQVLPWINLGQARRGQGDLPGALAAFAQAVHLAPNNVDAHVGTALAYLSQGQTAQARAALEPVRDQAMPLAVLGLADLHEGHGAGAEKNLLAALALDPRLYPAHSLLALAYLTRGALSEAEAAAREAVAAQPDSAQTEGALAMVLFFANKRPEAEAASRKAVRWNPRSPFALLTEGRVLLARQQTDAARAAFETAAAVAPSLWLTHEELGAVYLRLDMPKKAEEEYRIALSLDPDSADVHTGLGLSLGRQGRWQEAEAQHRQALILDPNNATAHGNLAALYIEQGQLDQARQELETGIKDAPERGILYARLAEISLYRQDLPAAQDFARRAVRLLPDSAVAHYELGRVYQEQERTVQAEQEFRQATTLDRQFAAARFALGLTEEAAEAGRDLSRPLGAIAAANQSGASGVLNIQNLQTAGAEERIQAAIQDPTVVRIASRSFGDAQIDGRVGEQGTRDFDLSYLHDSSDRRSEVGLTAQHLRDDGVRDNAYSNDQRLSLTLGGKTEENALGAFFLGEVEQTNLGLDTGIDSDPIAATRSAVVKRPFALLGFTHAAGESQRTRALVEYDDPRLDDTDALGFTQVRFRSLHAEVRQDMSLGGDHQLSLGAATGYRHQETSDLLLPPDPMFPPIRDQGTNRVHLDLGYVRDEVRLGAKVMLTGEMKVCHLSEADDSRVVDPPDLFPPTSGQNRTTVGLPDLIVQYQPDPEIGLRLRARRLLGAIQDFELLSPRDVFLFSVADVPLLSFFGSGWSYDLEYDQTFHDASFLRLGLFQQDLNNASDAIGESLLQTRFRGGRASYEGILSRDTTFFVNAEINDAHSIIDPGNGQLTPSQAIPDVPRFLGEAGVQFLSQAGWFVQPSYGYVGSRLQTAAASDRFGGFDVVNLRVGKRSGLRSSVFLELTNALNRTYNIAGQTQALGELQPGRLFRAGASFRF